MNYKHGLSGTRLYRIWNNMIDRCSNESRHNYQLYGGKGIEVCDEWRSDVSKFYKWAIENGYSDNLTLDRIDGDGNYEPSNCRWVDVKTQSINKRSTILITYEGETKPLKHWCEDLGVSYQKIKGRIHNGLTFEQALNMPYKAKSKYYLKQLKGEM